MDEQTKDSLLTEAMNEYGDYLVQLCYTYVLNWQTAEDLAQETFIRYYNNLPKFRGEASVKTYLFRIAVNVCKDYLSSWKYKKVHISEIFQKLLKSEDTPEKQAIKHDEQAQLVKGIEGLQTKYKDVLLLFHFGEMTLEEVSFALNIPVNTVKTRLRRARRTLGIALEEGGGEDHARSNS